MIDIFNLVKAVRFAYRQLRFQRGLGRLVRLIASIAPRLQETSVTLIDGRVLTLDLRESMSMPYLLTGEIWGEQGETEFTKYVVQPGDIVLDIGANVGWYSTLFAERVGKSGKVFGFEPSPNTYSLIRRTAERYPQMTVFQIALSDSHGEVDFFVASDGAHNSLQRQHNSVQVERCFAKPLDAVLREHCITDVKFVKCDAEGAEMQIVKGAAELISGEHPPVWMMEINPVLLKQFGSTPEGIFELFRSVPSHNYKFYQINSETKHISALPSEYALKFDAVIVPAWQQDLIRDYQAFQKASLVTDS